MYLERDDASIWYDTLGEGQPILSFHGPVGLDHSYFRPWLDPLSAHHQLVFFDHRGSGRSSEPADWSAVTRATWIDDAFALQNHLDLAPAILLGHSYGAYLALEFALCHPSRVAGLILCGGAATIDYLDQAIELARARDQPAAFQRFVSVLADPPSADDKVGAMWRDISPLYLAKPTTAQIEAIVGNLVPRAATLRRSFFELLPDYDMRPHLGEILHPTLVIAGAHDFIAPVEWAARPLHQGLPMSQLSIFGESGHFPFIEEHGRFLDVVSNWIRPPAP